MALQNNPFYVLKLPCSAGRREVMAAADELSFLLDPSICSEAQNELINVKKRLRAELGWFPELSATDIDSVIESIEQEREIRTDGLLPLSKLNAILHNFTISASEDPFEIGFAILDIDEQFSSLNAVEIVDLLNQNRQTAKVASVQESDIVGELNYYRTYIRQVIFDKLARLDRYSYIELITMLAEKCDMANANGGGIVLSDVIDQYEVSMQTSLEETSSAIENHISRIQQLSDPSSIRNNIDSLIVRVREWDKLAQPLQLKSKASGMPHPISESLGRKLRGLALFLHNEKGLSEEALSLLNAMKEVFAELGNIVDMYEEDTNTLSEVIQGKKDAEEIVSELNAIHALTESIKAEASTSKITLLINQVLSLDRKLKGLDLDLETKTQLRENLCYLARGVALELHNSKHDTYNAWTIAKALVTEFSDLPSLNMKLADDVSILGRQMVSQTPATHSYGSSTSKTMSFGAWVAMMAVAFVVMIIAISAGSSSSSKTPTTTPTSTSTVSNTTSTVTTYTVTFNKGGGTGGTSSVSVESGNAMPKASAPSKTGYNFKGYYASVNGGGTKYYDSNMKSVHDWDKNQGGTLYAYWEKKPEKKFTSSATAGEDVYIDIVSIFPEIGLYTKGQTFYTEFVCRCETSTGSTVWVYMTVSEYKKNFDANASTSIFNEYADEVTFTNSKRIHGVAKKADSVMQGLSSDTGTMLIDFSSVG